MAAKKNPVADFIAENGADGAISAPQLAELVGRDAKTVRGYLRRIKARNQAKYKGARWTIDETVATEALEHFTALDEKAKEQAS